MERTWARPTLDVHGMPGGFIGAGAKTVIPARATAKVSLPSRPDMAPAETFAQYKAYVESICPRGIRLSVRLIHSGDPIVVSTDNKYVQAAKDAMAHRLQRGNCLRPWRRLHSHRRRLRPRTRHSNPDDGLRPAGRQSPRAQ